MEGTHKTLEHASSSAELSIATGQEDIGRFIAKQRRVHIRTVSEEIVLIA